MSFEEEFDKGIKNKMEEASYPFDQANWEKASALLDAERKAAAPLGAAKYYIPALLLGVVTLSCVLFYYNQPENIKAEASVRANDPSEATVTLSNKQDNILAQNEPLPSETKVTLATDKKSEKEPSTVEVEAVKNKAENTLTEKSKADENKITLNTPISVNDTKITATNDNEKTSQIASQPEPAVEKNTTPVYGKTIPVAEPVFAIEPQNVFSTPHPDETKDETEKLNNASESITQEDNNALSESTFEYLTLLNLNNSWQEAEFLRNTFVFLQRYDDDYYKKLRRYKTHFITLEAGTNYNLGWQIANTADGKGFNWFGGVNYAYYLNKKMALGAGLQAYNLGNTSQNFYEVSSKSYDFGSVTTGTVISSKNLFYFAIPLRMYYALNKNNQLGLGFNAAYLFNAKSNEQTYSMQEGATVYNKNEVVKGVYSVAQPYNFMLSAFYKLQLAKRFAVNAEAVYGLTDIFKNTGNIKAIETPMGLRLSLQYTLFDK